MSSKTKRRSKSPKLEIKNIVRGSSDKSAMVNQLREHGEGQLVSSLAPWMKAILASIRQSSPAVAKSVSQLTDRNLLAPVNLLSELRWLEALISQNRSLIRSHIELDKLVRSAVISGNLEGAVSICDRAIVSCGYTLYWVSLKIAFVQLNDGLEAQKRYCQELRHNGAKGSLPFFIYWWSMSVEDKTSRNQYFEDVARRSIEWGIDKHLAVHIRYHLLGECPGDDDQNYLIAAASSGTVVDGFEMLITAVTNAVSKDYDSKKQYRNILENLSRNFSDERIQRLLNLFHSPLKERLACRSTNYRVSCRNLIREGSIQSMKNGDAELFPTLHALSSSDPEKQREAVLTLDKLSLMLKNFSLGRWVSAIVSTNVIDGAPVTNESRIREYVDGLTASEVSDMENSASSILPMGQFSDVKIQVLQMAFLANDHGSILSYVPENELVGSDRSSTFIYLNSLISTGNYMEALVQSVDLLIVSEKYISWVPASRLMSMMYDGDCIKPEYRKVIDSSVLHYFFEKFVDDSRAELTAFSAEDFVIANGFERPSQFFNSEGSVGISLKLELFLSKLCTIDRLDQFFCFAKVKETYEERILICRELSDLDEGSRPLYEEEARQLVLQVVIGEANRKIHRSKISISTERLYDWAIDHLREPFERYKALIASGVYPRNDEYDNVLWEAVETRQISKDLFNVPKNEASDLLYELISRYLQQCAADPEHGLDSFLSLRIRHGTLSGMIRSPAEEEMIATRIDGETRTYLANSHWADVLSSDVSSEVWDSCERHLNKFSSELDSVIDLLKERDVQLKTADNPEGLFYIKPSPPIVYAASLALDSSSDFDDFISQSNGILWAVVEENLTKVRSYIDEEVREAVSKVYADLEHHLREFSGAAQLADAVLRAKDVTQKSIDQVRDWFELPTPTAGLKFKMSELLEIPMETVKKFHPDFQPTFDFHQFSKITVSGGLSLYTDVFFILFENVHKHSGLKAPEVTVVQSYDGESTILFRVENNLSTSLDIGQIEGKIARIKAGLPTLGGKSTLTKEGGTGFFKLYNILSADDDDSAGLDLGIVREGPEARFWVEFGLHPRSILVHD